MNKLFLTDQENQGVGKGNVSFGFFFSEMLYRLFLNAVNELKILRLVANQKFGDLLWW